MSIILLGLNYKSAPVEIREKVSMSKSNIKRNLEFLQQMESVDGIAVLSTCNRTEFYMDARDGSKAVKGLMKFISWYSKCPTELLEQHMYVKREREAVEHLFTVAAGLDSHTIDGVVGCIAGDDTIFVAVDSVENANNAKNSALNGLIIHLSLFVSILFFPFHFFII